MKWILSLLFCIPVFGDSIDTLIKNVPTTRESVNQSLKGITTDAPLFTPDGKAFQSNLSCKSANVFLVMLSQQNNYGDIDYLDIIQDTDFDGSLDFVFSLPIHISGICTRGIVNCTPGTFKNCQYYSWQASNNLKIRLKQEPLINDLGTCVCINNSCRQGQSESTKKRNMEFLLGAVTTTLNKYSALTQITASDIYSNFASAYGVKSAGCGNMANAQVFSNMKNMDIQQSKNNIRTNRGNQFTQLETGIFQTVKNSGVASSTVKAERTCSIDRTINFGSVNNNNKLLNSFQSDLQWEVFACAKPNCIKLVYNNRYSLAGQRCVSDTHYIQFDSKKLKIKRATLTKFIHANRGNYFGLDKDYKERGIPHANCASTYTESRTPYPNFASYQILDTDKKYLFTQPRGVSSARYEIIITIEYENTTLCPIQSEIVSDNCKILENNQSCTLLDETQDTIKTIVNGVSTGLIPTPVTKTLSACAIDITRPFWYIKRKYKCKEKVKTDLTSILNRHEKIVSTSTRNSYTDTRKTKNGLVTENITYRAMSPIKSKGCIQKCKVKKKKQISEVMNQGTKSNLVFQDTYTKFYTCAKGICPKAQDEQIVTGCGCFSKLKEASLQMQLIRMTGKDVLCVK